MGIGNWIWSIFNKAKAIIARAFQLAKPFVKEFLSEAAAYLWTNCQDLLMEAVGYVETQGLPTTAEKQKAFKDFMQAKSTVKLDTIKENDFALVRDMALAAWKKAHAE